jgi:hypothetical protein
MLELIALRLSEPEAPFEYVGMATLFSPALAITTYHVAREEQREVLLHFDFWPEPFDMPARVVAVDSETNLAVLTLESKLPAEQVPSFKLATDFRAIEASKWESVLLPPSPGARLKPQGRSISNDGRIIRLLSDDDGTTSLGDLIGYELEGQMSGAPVVVEDALIGIISAYSIGRPQVWSCRPSSARDNSGRSASRQGTRQGRRTPGPFLERQFGEYEHQLISSREIAFRLIHRSALSPSPN